MRPGKTMAPISAQDLAIPLWNTIPYSKSTEALTNVSYPPAWTNVGCGPIPKDWIWAIFLGLPVASLYKLFSNKILFKCNSVWLRRAMAKLPPAPGEFSILLFLCFKIFLFYLLIFLLLFFFFFFWVLYSAATGCSLHSENEETSQPCPLRASNWAVPEVGWSERHQ